jgi:hypothetical protein
MTTMSDVTVAMKSTINSNLCSKMMHPPHSFKNSNASPKVKITKKKERVGVRSLARSTAREEGHDGAPKWGLGGMTSSSIIHTNMYKPNNNWLMCGWSTFGARTNHGLIRLTMAWTWGKPPTSPLYYSLLLTTWATYKCHFFPGLPSWEFRNSQNWDSWHFGGP